MKFQQQSYRSRSYRPSPEVYLDEQSGLFMVVTPWGNPDAAKKVVSVVSEYIKSSSDDSEVTSPFELITCLSPLANDVRTALLLANDSIYQNENKSEYTVGLEVTVFARRKTEICIGQVGNPSVYIKKSDSSILPLAVGVDNFSTTPLPLHLLGVDAMNSPNISSLRISEKDEFIFLSRSMNGTPILRSLEGPNSISQMAQQIIRHDSEIPFWIGSLFDL